MWMAARILISVLLSAALVTGQGGYCPEKYLRFSQYHTYCAQTGCNILSSGVTEDQKREIVDVHNFYRNKIAMGNEPNGGGMPTASKMIEMVWDQELADIAQKQTETCNYRHDCLACKRTLSYGVGQNIGLYPDRPVNWTEFLTHLYDEVSLFHYSKMNPYKRSPPGVKYGHFTQMVWDTTWNVGCGMSQFMNNGYPTIYYSCNYGPGGNIRDGVMYETGNPASRCPANTCSQTTCRNYGITPKYQGLCKVINEQQPPEGSAAEPGSIFYCNFLGQADCQFSVSGASGWTNFNSRGDNYATITLEAGQSTTITFTNPFRISRGNLCIDFLLRRQPAREGDVLQMDTSNRLISPDGMDWTGSYPNIQDPEFWVQFVSMSGYPMPVRKNQDFKYSLTFSVPSYATKQIVEITNIVGKEC